MVHLSNTCIMYIDDCIKSIARLRASKKKRKDSYLFVAKTGFDGLNAYFVVVKAK